VTDRGAGALLADLRRRGVACVVADGRVRVIAAPGTLTDADAAALRDHRTALLALLAGAEDDRSGDASEGSATVQHCNGQAENGPIRVQTEASGTVAVGVATAPLDATVPARAADRGSAPASATVAATPESAVFRVQNGPSEGEPLQCCTVADPSEALCVPACATVAELAETLLTDLARAGWPWPDDGDPDHGPGMPEDQIRAAWEAWARAAERTEDELDGAWQQVDRMRWAAR
jgi:hypothetical protein